MVNPFPTLLIFSFFAPTVLRITVSIFFLSLGVTYVTKKRVANEELLSRYLKSGSYLTSWVLGLGYLAIGSLLFFGLLTQIAALLAMIESLCALFLKNRKSELAILVPYSESTYTLLAVVSFVLLFLGAGAFAIDLPL